MRSSTGGGGGCGVGDGLRYGDGHWLRCGAGSCGVPGVVLEEDFVEGVGEGG